MNRKKAFYFKVYGCMICKFLYCNSLYHSKTLAAFCYFDQLQLHIYESVDFKTCQMPKI